MQNRLDHIQKCSEQYKNLIQKSILETSIQESFLPLGPCPMYNTITKLVDYNVLDCLFETNENDRVAVLNQASFKAPASNYLSGETEIEEILCDASYLYNVLSSDELSYYYKRNSKNLNFGLYQDIGLFIPDVVFHHHDEHRPFHVISCTAPNKAMKFKKYTKEEHDEALESRIDFLLNMAAVHHIDTLILGAFGCLGNWQSPTEVARIFFELLKGKYKGYFKKVVFQVTKESHYNAFHWYFN